MESQNVTIDTAAPKPRLFNSGSEFVIPILSGGEKRCTVRFPTDAEWIARAGRQKTVQHMLGRGKSRSEVLNSEAIDAELFAKIRKDEDGPEFDQAEASAVIARLERTTITEVNREGNNFRVKMRVPGATVEHVLRIPTCGEVDAYSAASVSVTSGRRQQEIRINLEPAAVLYDKIHVSHEGYAGAAPIPHKDAAVFEVIAQLRALEDEIDDPEN